MSQDAAEQTVVEATPEITPVFDEIVDNNEDSVKYVGQCKWFSDKLGYGFLTICDGEKKGMDIFSHHSGIKPLNSNYKTLKKGEYVEFSIVNGINGLQAVNVTGINGGALMCDFVTSRKQTGDETAEKPAEHEGWQQVRPARAPRQQTQVQGGPPAPPPRKRNVAKYNKNATK